MTLFLWRQKWFLHTTFLLLITPQKTSWDFEPLILMTKYCLVMCAFIFDSSISLTYSWGKLQNSHIKTISRKASLLSKILCSNIILTIPRLQRLYFLGSFSDKEFTALSWPPLGRSWRWQWWWWWWWYSQYKRSPSCWCCQ